ncbi:MAG: acetate--CoA ligase family protein [Deferrisomatales bacterium]|nr:acetate--CoA ligase family protein [Deferrisomatales bacterium]
MAHPLERVFQPRSVAIFGASEVPGKAGERRTRSLVQGGFAGRILPINPKRDRIFDLPAFPGIEAIDGEVDLAMIVIPPRQIPDAVAGSIAKGAKGIVIITAGLGESGAEGKGIEAEILGMAREAGVQLIGPNCSGMFSAAAAMNLLGIPEIRTGHVAVLAQSGNIIDSLTHYARAKGGGFSKILSVGNAIGVRLHEVLTYLAEDPDTRVIALYLEGIREGRDFLEAAREVTKVKPVVALKVGRTRAGARAAASHTGSLAGDDAVVDAAFRQAGILRVTNPDELFDVARVLDACPPPRGRRVAILSEGGGDNSVAADNAERHGLEVPVLPAETQERLRPFLLAGMPASNPIDYGGTAEEDPHRITECCRVCLEDDTVDGIFVTGFFGGFRDIIAPHVAALEEQTARELGALVRAHGKPLVINTSYAHAPYPTFDILREEGVPVFDGPDRAVQCLAALMQYHSGLPARRARPRARDELRPSPAAAALLAEAKGRGHASLLEPEGLRLLGEYGLPVLPSETAATEEDAVRAARRLGYPVVLKVVSRDILHKSDVGGVALHLGSDAEVGDAFRRILTRAREVTSPDRIGGVLVTPLAAKGTECVLGMSVDPVFGPVLMFGLGGVFVEVLRDVSFRVAPVTEDDAADMLGEIKGARVLGGIRGEPPRDAAALREALQKLSTLALCHPEIQEIDLNPVLAHEKGISIVDCRVILAGPDSRWA